MTAAPVPTSDALSAWWNVAAIVTMVLGFATLILLTVGFWNFTGAGIFGFLINTPIVSYFEMGTNLTPNHGHAAMMGVFGMLCGRAR